MQVAAASPTIVAQVVPKIQVVDSMNVVPNTPGFYTIVYTPTVAGNYDINVKINGADLSTDLTAGIFVTPALEYAATSTHNISQVNVEGIREYFTVQLRDRFGNSLTGPLADTSSLRISMIGLADICQGDNGTTLAAEIELNILDSQPYTDGIYTMFYDPTIAGSYDITVQLLTRGGLLATYFKSNLSNPVLASLGNLHDGSYHNPYWCAGLNNGNFSSAWTFGPVTFCDQTIQNCGCDSTRLDSVLSFN